MSIQQCSKEMFHVDAILGTRIRSGEREFLVRWKNYTPADDSWEPIENLKAVDVFKRYVRENPAAIGRSEALQAIESIYVDLHAYTNSGNTQQSLAPLDVWENLRFQANFRKAHSYLPLDNLVICMFTRTFASKLRTADVCEFEKLLAMFNSEVCASLRMFVQVRGLDCSTEHIPNPGLYWGVDSGIIKVPRLSPELSSLHVHDIYLKQNGEIARNMFTFTNGPNRGKSVAMNNTDSNIYKAENFDHVSRPATWPSEWTYPSNPDAWRTDNAHVECLQCEELWSQDPIDRVGQHKCICTMKQDCLDPLVEIVEYDPFPGSNGALNRGVRSLTTIPAGTILKEYTGEFIPKHDAAENWFGDDVYNFDFETPQKLERDGRVMRDQHGDPLEAEPLCVLSAGKCGNWTKFVNTIAYSQEANNCKFEQMVFDGKNRILLISEKDILFGDEITAWYGPAYATSLLNPQVKRAWEEEAKQRAWIEFGKLKASGPEAIAGEKSRVLRSGARTVDSVALKSQLAQVNSVKRSSPRSRRFQPYRRS